MWYLYVKALHIISIVAWFAALFYLPRLYVYHAEATDEVGRERFKVMERRLYRGIANPAMMASILFGAILVGLPQGRVWASMGWFHAKMAMVALLLIYHFVCKYHLKQFAQDKNSHSPGYFRWFNEIPTVLLVVIVFLVVAKPF